MASNGEVLDAVREVQMYNLQLYKYLTTGLVENSLVHQIKVEFDEYKRFSMEFFTRMDDPNIPLVKKQEAQINVFMADVKKNDKLRRGVTNIQRSLVARCNLGQPIPMVDGNMILQDFPELCVFNTSFSVPLTVLCDLILHKYNIHNQSAIMDMMRLAEEERISRMMSNPVPIRHSQNRPILPSDRPATVNGHQGGHITLMEAKTITSTPAGLITLPEAETITSTPAELITLTEAETITSTPEGLITLPEAETITSTPAGLITLTEAETITSTPAGLITLPEAETITSTTEGLITLPEAETITSTPAGLITLPEAETITSTPAGLITLPEAETITSTTEGLITLPEAETITSTPAGLITLPGGETITSTPARLITLTEEAPITSTEPEPIAEIQTEPITESQSEHITDSQAAITDTQAEPITDTQAAITDPQSEPITETKAEFVITQVLDDTPVMLLDDASVETTANIGVDDIKLSDSMDDFIKELVQPTTLCNPLHSAQVDVPSNDEDTCDQLLSFLKDIPELNPDHGSLPKNSTISTATPKSVTPSLALQKNTIYAVTEKKKEAKRDYKEYPEYTPRTDPVISWDELIVKYKKLANTNNQEQSTNQEMISLLPEAAKLEAVSQIEEVKPVGQSQTLDVEESPSCSQSTMVPCEQVDLGNQDVPMEVTTEQCEKVNGSPSMKVIVPCPVSSKEIKNQKPMTDTKSSKTMVEIIENKTKRKQHTPKHPTENVSKRVELLAALEKKKQKAQRILNEQYNKSWDGKIFARSKAQSVSTVEKTTKPTVTTVPSKYQRSTKVGKTQDAIINQQPAKVAVQQPSQFVSQQAKVVSHPAKVVSQPAKVVSHPAKVVSQPAKVVSHPAKVVSQPIVSQSRKRPAPSSVDTVMSASSAKRRREYKHRIILRIFREDSDWNVEQIVDRF